MSENIESLKKYAEFFGVDTSRTEYLVEEIKRFYWSLTDMINGYGSTLTFELTPIIDEDPLSKIILQNFINKHEQDDLQDLEFNKWEEPILLYFILKKYFDIIQNEYELKNKTPKEYADMYSEYSSLYSLVGNICGFNIEKIYNKIHDDDLFTIITELCHEK